MAELSCRVALVSDFLEENWPSMDHVSDMLLDQLSGSFRTQFQATRLRPPLRRVAGRVPGLGSGHAARTADRVLGRFIQYPRFLRTQRTNFDVFHVLDHSYAHLVHELPGERTVVTCHDLDAFRSLIEPENEPRTALFRRMARRVLSGLKRAARVTCDSEATRRGLIEYGLVPEKKTVVVPLGVDAVFTAAADAGADLEASRLLGDATTRTELLHVGSTVDRKRIDVLLRVFAALRSGRPDLRLVRVGGALTAAQAALGAQLGVLDGIDVMPVLSRPVLAALYRRAALVLLPSEREGFGFPVIEALASGTPILASDLGVLRELGGDAAEYCAAGDVAGWARAAERLLEEREQAPAVWERRRQAGIERAALYSWRACAAGMIEQYKLVAGFSRRGQGVQG